MILLRSLSSTITAIVIGFFSSILLSRLLGPEGRGYYFTLTFFASLIYGVSQLGLAETTLYYYRKGAIELKNSIAKKMTFVLLVSLFPIAFSVFYIKSIPEFSNETIVFFLILCIANIPYSFLLHLSQVEKNLYFYNKTRVIIPVLSVAGLCLLYGIDDVDVNSAIGVLCLSNFLGVVYLSTFFIRNEFPINKGEYNNSEMTIFSLQVFGTNISGIIVNNLDKIILINIVSAFDLGLYTTAYATSRLIGFIPQTMSTIAYSRFAGRVGKDAEIFFNVLFSSTFIPCLILSILLGVMSFWFFPFLFGVEFSSASIIFLILSVECVLSGFSWFVSQYFNSKGNPKIVLIRQWVSMFPLIFIMFYSGEYIIMFTSLLLLFSSLIRLLVSCFLFNRESKKCKIKLLPSICEIKKLREML